MNLEKFNEINKDTLKAEEMMSPEEKEMSRDREQHAIWFEIEKRAEHEAEEMRPKIESQMKRIVREDMLNDRMVRSVVHEYKKLRELYLADALLSDNKKGSYSAEAWRGRNALEAFGMQVGLVSSVEKKEIESIKNTVDVDRYSKLLAANLSLIDAIFSGDDGSVEDSLKQMEILDPDLTKKCKERAPAIKEWSDKWRNGEIFIETNNVEARRFSDATTDEKLEFVSLVAEKKCFNFYTDAEARSPMYCMGCGRVPEGFEIKG